MPRTLSPLEQVILAEKTASDEARANGTEENGSNPETCNRVVNVISMDMCSAFMQNFIQMNGGSEFGFMLGGAGQSMMHVLHHLVHHMRLADFDITYLELVEFIRLSHFQFGQLNFRTAGSYAGFTLLMLVAKAKLHAIAPAEEMRLLQFLQDMGACESSLCNRGTNAVMMAAASANTEL